MPRFFLPLIVLANWVIICYLPPIEGTRKLHWMYVFLIHNLDRTRIRGTFFAVSTSRPLWPLCHKTRRGLTATRFQLKKRLCGPFLDLFFWWCCCGFDHGKSPLNSTSIWGNICFHVFFWKKNRIRKNPKFSNLGSGVKTSEVGGKLMKSSPRSWFGWIQQEDSLTMAPVKLWPTGQPCETMANPVKLLGKIFCSGISAGDPPKKQRCLPRNKALFGPLEGTMLVNSPLISCFLGGGIWGVSPQIPMIVGNF